MTKVLFATHPISSVCILYMGNPGRLIQRPAQESNPALWHMTQASCPRATCQIASRVTVAVPGTSPQWPTCAVVQQGLCLLFTESTAVAAGPHVREITWAARERDHLDQHLTKRCDIGPQSLSALLAGRGGPHGERMQNRMAESGPD